MEIGACPRCARPYTASDIVGLGILRPRVAREGGPLVEYTCPECGKLLRLIPHGEGRYAAPGDPPPPPVPEAERRPAWVAGRTVPPPTDEPAPEPRQQAETADAGREPDEAEEVPPAADEAPLDAAQALALLGCELGADRRAIERAFRARSRTCHPDKVAHLDPEFQALAERKFKRLSAARDLLLS